MAAIRVEGVIKRFGATVALAGVDLEMFGRLFKLSGDDARRRADELLERFDLANAADRAARTYSGGMRRRLIDRFRSMPMARSAVLLGRTLADLVRNVVIIGLMIGVGYLIGFRFHGGLSGDRLDCDRRGVRLRAQLDLRLRRTHGPRRRGGPVGQLCRDFPARVRELGVRADLDDARLAPGDREGEPRDADGRRRALIRADRIPWLARRRPCLDRRHARAVFLPLSVWRYRRMG
jgi:hypothetical protein